MMELTSYRGQDKNRADIALVVDAMELVYSRPHIQTFVLLSGDSDFTPLVMKLRELDKRIIGLGTRKATSRLLASSCDEFIFYDNLLKRSHREEESNDETSLSPKPITSQEAFTLLVDTIKVIQRDEPRPVSAGMVKQFILRKTPTFDETDFGYSGFTDFLEAADKAQLVQLINNDKGGGYLVSIKGKGPIVQKVDLPKYKNQLAQAFSEKLIEDGFHPTKHFIRHTVVHEFVDHILERRAKKKRSTLVFTYGDIARRCRKTEPSASTSEVDSILNALYKAGELYGNDQKPIRSKKANFTIKKDAEELLKTLRSFYVELLVKHHEEGFLAENIEALCELLWNDTIHIEETKAILQAVIAAQTSDAESENGELASATTLDTVETNSKDKVSSSTTPNAVNNEPINQSDNSTTGNDKETTEDIKTDGDAKTTSEKVTEKKTAAKKTTRRKNSASTKTTVESPTTETKTKRSTARKKTAKITKTAAVESAADSTETTQSEEPKKPVKKAASTTKKKASTTKTTAKKATAKKTATKTATEEAAADETTKGSTTEESTPETKKSTTKKAANKTTKKNSVADTSKKSVKPKKTTRKKAAEKSTEVAPQSEEQEPKKTTRRKKSSKSDEAPKE